MNGKKKMGTEEILKNLEQQDMEQRNNEYLEKESKSIEDTNNPKLDRKRRGLLNLIYQYFRTLGLFGYLIMLYILDFLSIVLSADIFVYFFKIWPFLLAFLIVAIPLKYHGGFEEFLYLKLEKRLEKKKGKMEGRMRRDKIYRIVFKVLLVLLVYQYFRNLIGFISCFLALY